MTNKIVALEQANRNVKNSQDLLITADTGMASIRTIVERLREIGVESTSDTMTNEERVILSSEYDQLLEEAEFVVSTTKYNGIELLGGDFTNKIVAIGINDDPDQRISISLGDASADVLGKTKEVAGTPTLFAVSDSSVDDSSKSLDAVETLDAALEQLIEHQARIGATIRRFDFTISNLESMVLQTENNRNSLTALDEAREITDMSINQIKQQTALAMMAQAQSLSQTIFQLLQNH